MREIRKLILGVIAVVTVTTFLYTVNYFSTISAQYFNNYTAIQFLEWMYRL